MPETALIPELVAAAQTRTRAMLAASAAVPAAAQPSDPPPGLLPQWPLAQRAAAMAELAASARAEARPTGAADYGDIVWGEGPLDAALMLVGEQPGDQEDFVGRPFVGPAGQLLDRALAEAGIERSTLYLTNAYKRFKHLPQGKRRLHQSPSAGEIDHARWWLTRERGIIRPRVILALGASAARGVLGNSVPVERSRGSDFPLDGGSIARVTGHPSAILRIPDAALAAEKYRALVSDLRAAHARAA
jgi:DNA polymerase